MHDGVLPGATETPAPPTTPGVQAPPDALMGVTSNYQMEPAGSADSLCT